MKETSSVQEATYLEKDQSGRLSEQSCINFFLWGNVSITGTPDKVNNVTLSALPMDHLNQEQSNCGRFERLRSQELLEQIDCQI